MRKTLKSFFSKPQTNEKKPDEKKSEQVIPDQKNSRKHIRYPSFSIQEIVSRDNQGNKKSMNIAVRDESHMGFGSIYVGPTAPAEKNEYYVQEKNNAFRKIELSWTRELIKNVFFLGFKILDEKHYTEIPS